MTLIVGAPVRVPPILVAVAVLLTLATACATRRPDPTAEGSDTSFRCNETTVVTINNQSDVVYYVVARNGLKELRLGTAIPGRTRFSTPEPVTRVYLAVPADTQPTAGRSPGNYGRPRLTYVREVNLRGAVELTRACS